jgi:uncharacterized membrane protein YkoI
MTAAFLMMTTAWLVPPEGTVEKLLNEARVSLDRALEAAVQNEKEAAAVAVRLKQIKGRTLYDVRYARGEKSYRTTVDAKTAEVVDKVEIKHAPAKALAKAKVALPKAIEIAVKKVSGKAVGGDLEIENGVPVYEVEVFADGVLYEVEVDGITGDVLEVDQEDDDDGEDDDEDGDDDDDEDDD